MSFSLNSSNLNNSRNFFVRLSYSSFDKNNLSPSYIVNNFCFLLFVIPIILFMFTIFFDKKSYILSLCAAMFLNNELTRKKVFMKLLFKLGRT